MGARPCQTAPATYYGRFRLDRSIRGSAPWCSPGWQGVYDVAAAYVSERRSDDPALYRRIVISIGPDTRPSHLVHAPVGISCWLVTAVGQDLEVQKYNSLRAALNSIRKVFTLSAAASER